MAAELTVDNLCVAIRHFLQRAAEEGIESIGSSTLTLMGVPADDTMKAVMELVGGVLRIEVRELPAELSIQPLPANPEAVNLWLPSKEPAKA